MLPLEEVQDFVLVLSWPGFKLLAFSISSSPDTGGPRLRRIECLSFLRLD
ncbi:hypothetical protein BVC80_8825g32 [Macleaya cordata]|uniref:Uncharacterized protein n=1 Tax=Macleaya cordata TaxID=56857 RepID=A0A200QAE7_MACCD|nr:hypothetical protein BVC80_8825g32 [Macleaya cordata]